MTRYPMKRHAGAPQRRSPLRTLTGAGLTVAVIALGAACAGSARHGVSPRPGAVQSSRPVTAGSSPSAQPAVAPRPVPNKVMLGAYLSLSGMDERQSIALRREQLGRDPRILNRFYDWNDVLPGTAEGLPAGSTLMVSWRGASYTTINSGSDDALIARGADALARYRQPVFLRWAWEMNGNWYAWAGARNNNDPNGFIAAWRHIHDIFVAHHASNVVWVWGPNYSSLPQQPWNDMTSYYPGDAYVDWVGVSGYVANRETVDELFGPVVHTYGARKPIMIAEIGALEMGSTVKAGRIDQLAGWIMAHPAVGALVWFDTDTDTEHGIGKNWRIDSTPASLAAYRRLANNPGFSG